MSIRTHRQSAERRLCLFTCEAGDGVIEEQTRPRRDSQVTRPGAPLRCDHEAVREAVLRRDGSLSSKGRVVAASAKRFRPEALAA